MTLRISPQLSDSPSRTLISPHLPWPPTPVLQPDQVTDSTSNTWPPQASMVFYPFFLALECCLLPLAIPPNWANSYSCTGAPWSPLPPGSLPSFSEWAPGVLDATVSVLRAPLCPGQWFSTCVGGVLGWQADAQKLPSRGDSPLPPTQLCPEQAQFYPM